MNRSKILEEIQVNVIRLSAPNLPEYKYIPLHQKPSPSVDQLKRIMQLLRTIIFPGFFGSEQEAREQSMEYYINNHPEVIQNIGNDEELNKKTKLAFEEQLVQKIMPKLRGIEVHGEEKKTLDNIKEILNQNEFAVTEDFELAMDNPYGQFIWNSANYLKED